MRIALFALAPIALVGTCDPALAQSTESDLNRQIEAWCAQTNGSAEIDDNRLKCEELRLLGIIAARGRKRIHVPEETLANQFCFNDESELKVCGSEDAEKKCSWLYGPSFTNYSYATSSDQVGRFVRLQCINY